MRPDRNIKLVYVFQALVNASLWMPIWVVFLNTDRQLSLSQVYLIAGAGWMVNAIAEVPSGAMADTYGRKVTLITGCLVLAVGLFLLATLTGFAALLVAYLFWAVGNALISGCDTALLYDSAVAAGRAADFTRMASKSFQVLLGAQAAGSILGGALAVIDLRLPILVTSAITLAAVAAVVRMVEPPRHTAASSMAGTLGAAAEFTRRYPRILSLLAYSALLSGTAFFVPFVLFQPAMHDQGVAVGWLGVLFTGLRLAALAGSRYGPRMISNARLAIWLSLIPVLMAAGFAAIAVSRLWWLTFPAMLYLAAVNAAIRPALTTLLNQQVTGAVRATVNSMQSLTMTLFIAALHPAVGAVADATSLSSAFVFLGVVCAVPLALAFPARPLVVHNRPTVPAAGEGVSASSTQGPAGR